MYGYHCPGDMAVHMRKGTGHTVHVEFEGCASVLNFVLFV